MNNEVSYAFEKTASPHINVILERFGNEVSLTFEDNGAAFDPLQEVTQERLEESEGGFGLSLVKAFSNAQHYERAGETNRLTVTKKML
jgi:anti-sigma regulatory factor (Ser/Thr protein kinase)